MKKAIFYVYSGIEHCIQENSAILLIMSLLLLGYYLYLEKFIDMYSYSLNKHDHVLMLAYMTGFISHVVISLIILKDELLNK